MTANHNTKGCFYGEQNNVLLMLIKLTTCCLKLRLERALERKKPGPPYARMKEKRKRHRQEIIAKCNELKSREMPAYAKMTLMELKSIDDRRIRAIEVWSRLIVKRKFLKQANHDWILSFENFVSDVGLPPTRKSILVKSDRHIKYTGSTCQWEG